MSHVAESPLDLAIDVRRTASSATDYLLAVPAGAQRRLARAWLWLGMLALVGAGLFSILLVLSRTPLVNEWFPAADFFRVALVVHVDLSVLVWFAALAGMLWSLNGSERGLGWAWCALGLCAAGAVIMSLAPFFGTGEAIMANYIPVLDDPGFIAGLLVFAAGAALLVLRVRGGRRFRVRQVRVRDNGLLVADVVWLADDVPARTRPEHMLLAELLRRMLERAVGEGVVRIPEHHFADAAWVGWRLAELLPLGEHERQALLQEDDVHARLQRLLEQVA